MKLTRRQLNNIILENLFSDMFGIRQKKKDKQATLDKMQADADAIMRPSQDIKPKFMVMPPRGGAAGYAESNYEILMNKIARAAGKDLGFENRLRPEDVESYLEGKGGDVAAVFDATSALGISKNLPDVKLIFSEINPTPDGRNMDIQLDLYYEGSLKNSTGGTLSGIEAGKREDGTHESDEQLARYVKELVA